MNDLEAYFRNNPGRLIHKWAHYFDIYDRHFRRFRNKPVNLLEIGVSQGGSLQMWKHYFGPQARIFGVDIDPKCKSLEEPNVQIFIGSQTDRAFLQKLKEQLPPLDILIDDGGHKMNQQIVTFEELFGLVKDDGVYLCEDTHTSFWMEYGGGYKRKGTFIEYSKNFVDFLHGWHSRQRAFRPNDFTRRVDSVHFYDSVVVIEKKKRPPLENLRTGAKSFDRTKVALAPDRQRVEEAKRRALAVINRVLMALRLRSFRW